VHPHVGHALLLLGCILFGASLFLVGQMENVSTHDPLAFLLWALAATGGAVLFRSQPFAALAAVTGGAWIVVELVDADAGSAALLAVGLYAVAVYAFGTRLGVGVLRALGAGGALAALFPLTFGEVADEVASADVGTAAVVAGVALAALALATAGWLATDAQRPTARAEAAACGVLVLLFCTAPLLDLGPLLPNVVLLALAAGAIAAGYATGEPWLASIGLAVATVEILVRFFDYFARIMPRSVAFLVGGAIALTLAWALERNHRRIVGRAAR
jgi:hypothetical protein